MFDLLLFQPAVVELGRRLDLFFRGLFLRRFRVRLSGCLRLRDLRGGNGLRAGLHRNAENQKRGERDDSLNRTRAGFGNAEEEREKDDGRGERVGGAFDGAEHRDCVFAVLAVEHLDARFEFVDAAVCGGGPDVDASGAAGKFGQLRLVERASDRIPAGIREHTELSVFARHADDRRVCGVAHADGEDRYLRLGEVADDGCAASREFVAVRHEDDCLVRTLRTFKSIYGFLKRELNVGAADGDRVGVEVVDELDEACAVDRERADQEGLARERDESEAVARILLDDFAHEPFRMVHAARLHVIGEHASGDVEQHQ